MFGNKAFGTRNSVTVATAQQTDKDLLKGLSKAMDRFTKKEAGVHSVEFFDMIETSIGTVQAQFVIGGKNVRLNISPLQGVGHTVGEGEKAFFKVESTSQVKSFSFEGDGYTITVPKDEVKMTLRDMEFGTPVSVVMENGYTFDGKVCDINRTDRFQFYKLFESMGDQMGIKVQKAIINGQVQKAILMNGTALTSDELIEIFEGLGEAPKVKCAFSTNNLTGKVSLYDIGAPEL